MNKRNTLMLVVDCLRQDVFSSASNYFLDMSREGCYFSQALTPIATTTPSIASMMTGLYPFEHGIVSLQGFKLDGRHKTLPQTLSEHGYTTLAFVTGPLLPETGLANGITKYHYRKWNRYFCGATEREILRSIQKTPEPWFVLLHVWEMHEPIYKRRSPAMRLIQRVMNRLGAASQMAPLDDTEYKKAYVEGLVNIERIVQRIRKALKDMDLLIITGDHGERLDEEISEYEASLCFKQNPRHGFNVYEYLLNVPLLFWGRDVPRQVVADSVRTIDIYPTLLEYLDIPCSGTLSGVSLWSLMRHGTDSVQRDLVCSASGVTLRDRKDWIEGIRTKRYKYTLKPASPRMEGVLYEINQSREVQLPLNGEYAQIVQELETRLHSIKNPDSVHRAEHLSEDDNAKVVDVLKSLGYI